MVGCRNMCYVNSDHSRTPNLHILYHYSMFNYIHAPLYLYLRSSGQVTMHQVKVPLITTTHKNKFTSLTPVNQHTIKYILIPCNSIDTYCLSLLLIPWQMSGSTEYTLNVVPLFIQVISLLLSSLHPPGTFVHPEESELIYFFK